jgi:L,D-peptidoglycan transpeptidase YkuD (ErfK/YbiS/YcfS/YnhG family)
MAFLLWSLFFRSALFGLPSAQSPGPQPLQAVVVLTKDWQSVPATLQFFERKNAASPWQPVGPALQAVVGRKGLGWGIGRHKASSSSSSANTDGPVKKEGDGKAPAGVFALGPAFGYASASSNSWIKLPYVHATEMLQCVDDPQSEHYNQLVDITKQKLTWGSHENMLLPDNQYRLGVVVNHNANPPVAGAGSCIFIHIWKGAATGTSGCTAMAPQDVEKLLRWLDPAKNPVLVQLSISQYQKKRIAWELPALPPTKGSVSP